MSRSGPFIALVSLAALLVAAAPAAAQAPRTVDVIVVVEDGARPQDVARDHRVDLTFVYRTALNGFAGSVPEGRLAGLEHDPRVDYVERDGPVEIVAVSVPTGIDRVDAEANTSIDIDGVDDLRVDVDVAIIDTGIDLDHPDLNVVGGVNCLESSGGPPWAREFSCVDGGGDGHGHGTHVAGTVAALDDGANAGGVHVVGVAPGARLHAVKVLDDNGSGSTGSVIAGIDWVTAHGGIEVANMSLGGSGESQAMDDALQASYGAGVAYAVAAGNSAANVDNYHPAGSPWVLTVSALADFDGLTGGLGAPTCRSDVDDTFADFSNFGATSGQDVDVIAPGVCILSTVPGGYESGWSGTSMASPHAAGAAALLASSGHTAAQIVGAVTNGVDGDGLLETSGGTDWDASDDPDGVKEPLVDVADSTTFAPTLLATGGTGNAAPTASFTSSCTDLSCSFDASASADSDGTIASYAWDFGDGATATGVTASHTYAAAGDYTVALTVTDDGGATGTDSQVVSVSDGSGDSGPTATHVHSLTGSSTNQGGTWTAVVEAFVHDGSGPVTGETITFHVVSSKGAIDATVECATGDGTCSVSVSGIPKRDAEATFTVTALSSGSLADSEATSITVAKP